MGWVRLDAIRQQAGEVGHTHTHARTHSEESFIHARMEAKMGADTWWVALHSALAHMAAMLAAKSIAAGKLRVHPESGGCDDISV